MMRGLMARRRRSEIEVRLCPGEANRMCRIDGRDVDVGELLRLRPGRIRKVVIAIEPTVSLHDVNVAAMVLRDRGLRVVTRHA